MFFFVLLFGKLDGICIQIDFRDHGFVMFYDIDDLQQQKYLEKNKNKIDGLEV